MTMTTLKKKQNLKKKKVVFVGKLLRFKKDRNIEFLVNAFSDKRLYDYKFTIVGGPNKYKDVIEKKIS